MYFLSCTWAFTLLLYSVANSSSIYLNKMRETEYDYIIVGAGSAGSVVASRLSEDVSTTVLLLEAGGMPNGVSEVPMFFGDNLGDPEMDWSFLTEPQKHACLGLKEKRSIHPRGKCLGGSSSLNANLHVRGNRRDFDEWAKNGSPGWAWDDVYHYFQKIENSQNVDLKESSLKGVHKEIGSLTITNVSHASSLQNAYLEAGKYLGYEIVVDSDENQIGFTKVQATTRDGRRCSTEKGYLRPAAKRENLDILIYALVTQILFDKEKRAHSVRFEHKNASQVVSARKEIIISAGAYGSPQILMLSGVGPKEHLQELAIPVISDLPVGENLQDHMSCGGLVYLVNSSVSFAHSTVLNYTSIGEFVEGKGPLTVPATIECMAYVNTKYQDPVDSWPDLQLFFVSSIFVPRKDIPEHAAYIARDGFTVNAMLRRPKGRGFVKLRSRDPFDHPIIDPRYLHEEDDVNRLLEAIKFVEKLTQTPPIQKFGARRIREIVPGCDDFEDESDEYLTCMARSVTITNFHPAGTCKMGDPKDATTVVDPQLRVKGVKGLRVVDASIMPLVVSGNTNAPTILIGEKAADMIRGQ